MRCSIFLLIGSLFQAAAQPSPVAKDDAWARLAGISRTQKVRVYLQDGHSLSGYIQSTRPEGLTLAQKERTAEIARGDIVKVTKTSRLRGLMWGSIIGFAIGAPIGAAAAGSIVDRNTPSGGDRLGAAAGVGILFSGIGAAIGGGVGVERTLYRPPKR